MVLFPFNTLPRLTRRLTAAVLIAASAAATNPAVAQTRGLSFVRDAETEATIRRIALPIFEAAGLNPGDVEVVLINDRTLNAFVATGQRVFIYTGLLLRVESPNQLAGVIAHETGHIAGGHLARSEDALRAATTTQIAMMLAGIAAGIAARNPGAGVAMMQLGNQAAERNLLQYSRAQESAADQAAITFLTRTSQSGVGLVQFLKILGDQEALLSERQDPYVRTHPVSSERIAALTQRVDASKYRIALVDADILDSFKRMQAKLFAYTEPVTATLRRYPPDDDSIYGHYARAIAWHRVGDTRRAAVEVEAVLQREPKNPYFLEMKAQTLHESGHSKDGLPAIEEAVKLQPKEMQFQLLYAQMLNEAGGAENWQRAILALKEVTRREPDNASAWRETSLAYGRLENFGMASYATAEWYFLIGDVKGAKMQVDRALRLLPAGSPTALRANDLSNQVETELKKNR